jgi:DNA modification methylase
LPEEGLNQSEPLSALETRHRILWGDATDMAAVADAGIDLVVTSPPYPMIEMWDRVFREQSAEAARALNRGRGMAAFEAMHQVLDRVWRALWRVMRPGAIACINIGDAVRTIGGVFTLYPNHARIHSALLTIGFNPLPAVIWRKQTNAPNKFMGSGMLPAGAYVTLEHEFVLVARKGDKRDFSSASGKQRRHESAYFWEERNQWFSDVWFDLKGSRQKLSKSERHRSGAFPVELAYRLINMYALRGDTVLDPFLGTGSTMIAAMAAGRHSIGVEIDGSLKRTIQAGIDEMIPWANQRIDQRLADHQAFVAGREQTHGPLRHRNAHYGFPVVTGQERQLRFYRPVAVRNLDKDAFGVDYEAENPRPADAAAPLRTRRRSAKSVATAASSRGQSTLPGF